MGQGDTLNVLDVIDFSQLGEKSLVREIVVGLKAAGRVVPLKLSNDGLQEKLEAWREANPEPEPPGKEVVIRSDSDLGKRFKREGYKGPWPAIRQVLDYHDKEYEQAHGTWIITQAWVGLSIAIKQSFVGANGKPIADDDHEGRIEELKRQGLMDVPASKLFGMIADETPVTDGEDAADFFAGASDSGSTSEAEAAHSSEGLESTGSTGQHPCSVDQLESSRSSHERSESGG